MQYCVKPHMQSYIPVSLSILSPELLGINILSKACIKLLKQVTLSYSNLELSSLITLVQTLVCVFVKAPHTQPAEAHSLLCPGAKRAFLPLTANSPENYIKREGCKYLQMQNLLKQFPKVYDSNSRIILVTHRTCLYLRALPFINKLCCISFSSSLINYKLVLWKDFWTFQISLLINLTLHTSRVMLLKLNHLLISSTYVFLYSHTYI